MRSATPTPRLGGYLLLVVFLSVLTCGVRFAVLQMSEPRTDQASFARWVRDLRKARRIFPQHIQGSSWRTALEGDSESLAHRYAIRIYNTVPYAFTSVALTGEYLLSFLTGDSYRAQVGMSILASAGVLLILGLAPYWLDGDKPRAPPGAGPGIDQLAGITALVLGGTSAYLHFWSSWGVHNWGLLSLLAAVAVISRFAAVADLLLIGLITVLAVYSHWTNIFLLPAAVAGLLILRDEDRVARRIRNTIGYLAIVGSVILPVILIALLKSETVPANLDYAAFERTPASEYALGCAKRALNWFSTGATVFSPPGLVMAIAGLLLLAWNRRTRLPLLVVAAHWACWVVIPGFLWNGSPTWIRTYPYALPFFCLGTGYALAAAVSGELGAALARAKLRVSNRIIVPVAAGLVSMHLLFQIGSFPRGTNAPTNIPEAQDLYGRGQGTLRPMVETLDGLVPHRATLLTWDYGLRDLYVTLLPSPREEIVLPPPVATMLLRHRAGGLADYLRRRRVGVPCDRPLFLLAQGAVPRSVIRQALSEVLSLAGQGCGSLTVEPLATWSTQAHNVEDVVLYSLREGERPW